MNAKLNLKSVKIKTQLAKLFGRFGRHLAFTVLLVVLVCYIFVVFRISGFANAKPTPDQITLTNPIPRIDKKAINQIQSLEQSSTQLRALFEQARNNPFSE